MDCAQYSRQASMVGKRGTAISDPRRERTKLRTPACVPGERAYKSASVAAIRICSSLPEGSIPVLAQLCRFYMEAAIDYIVKSDPELLRRAEAYLEFMPLRGAMRQRARTTPNILRGRLRRARHGDSSVCSMLVLNGDGNARSYPGLWRPSSPGTKSRLDMPELRRITRRDGCWPEVDAAASAGLLQQRIGLSYQSRVQRNGF